MANAKSVGVYLCKGCGISERLDVDQLEAIAIGECKATYVKQHDFLCSRAGVETIQSDLEAGEAERIVIAACSARSKTEAFRFDATAMARANLREGVIWIRPDTEEARGTSQEMADDYVRMACSEVGFMSPPAPSEEQSLNKNLLVVGGGYSGLTAAIEASKAGYFTTIVEKSGRLGGFATELYKRIPTRSPYAEPEETPIDNLVTTANADPNISIHLASRVTRTSGAPGRFCVDITHEDGQTRSANFGALVQASGFRPYDATQLTEFTYGSAPDVLTQAELEKLASTAEDGVILRPSNGAPVKSVVFVQCAGQRSERPGHLAYCSGFCCSASIKQAMYFKETDPDIETTVIYTDLRVPGAAGEDFYRSGQNKGITFSKGTVTRVTAEDEQLTVQIDDLILGEPSTLSVDLVVLATGLVPNTGIDSDSVALEDDETGGNSVEVPVESVLNLSYRQGTDLPHLMHGFADSHFICFPYETRRTGIYTTGPVRRPMDMQQAREDATGAAMKAIQAVENAGKGRAAHPRSGDLSFPRVRLEGCTQCKRCTVECPFGAIDEDEQRYPLFNESRCRRCGTCMGACPVRVISFDNYSIDTVGQQIKNVEIPDETEEKPRILVLACENDAYPALDMAAFNRRTYSACARVIPVRCLGSVNTIWITDALNSGYDGVVLMGCQTGDNYQCHFVKGSELAHYRMSKIDDTLQQLSLEKERVATYEVAITDIHRAPALIDEMAATIERIGQSPLKF